MRGLGLLVGLECQTGTVNSDLVRKMEAEGLLTVVAGNNVVRFIPPLIVEAQHIEAAVGLLDKVCAATPRS